MLISIQDIKHKPPPSADRYLLVWPVQEEMAVKGVHSQLYYSATCGPEGHGSSFAAVCTAGGVLLHIFIPAPAPVRQPSRNLTGVLP